MRHRHVYLLALLIWYATAGLHAAGAQDRLTLEDIHASAKFYGESFEGGRWAETGPVITYIAENDGASDLVSYNLQTDREQVLIEGARLRAPDVNRLIHIEDYAYSNDGNKVLLYTDSEQVWRYNTKGFYYIYDIPSIRLTPLS